MHTLTCCYLSSECNILQAFTENLYVGLFICHVVCCIFPQCIHHFHQYVSKLLFSKLNLAPIYSTVTHSKWLHDIRH